MAIISKKWQFKDFQTAADMNTVASDINELIDGRSDIELKVETFWQCQYCQQAQPSGNLHCSRCGGEKPNI